MNATTKTNRRLTPGTLVVSREDGEPGRIVRVCTFRRNGVDTWSYLVDTAAGREALATLPLQMQSGVYA